MPFNRCEYCNSPLPEYEFGRPLRFCSRNCGYEFFKEERKQAVAFFRASGMTVKRANEDDADQMQRAQA
jgi:hypothetical protein